MAAFWHDHCREQVSQQKNLKKKRKKGIANSIGPDETARFKMNMVGLSGRKGMTQKW